MHEDWKKLTLVLSHVWKTRCTALHLKYGCPLFDISRKKRRWLHCETHDLGSCTHSRPCSHALLDPVSHTWNATTAMRLLLAFYRSYQLSRRSSSFFSLSPYSFTPRSVFLLPIFLLCSFLFYTLEYRLVANAATRLSRSCPHWHIGVMTPWWYCIF